jgi:hypothetical protein
LRYNAACTDAYICCFNCSRHFTATSASTVTVSESCDNAAAAVDGDVATSAAALHETAADADAVFYSTNVLLILLDVSLSLCFTWAGPRPEQNNF